MAKLEYQYEKAFKAAAQKYINAIDHIQLTEIANKVAEKGLEINRERTVKGYDINGRRFPKLSRRYLKYKKKVVSGKYKLKESRTKYRAKGTPGHIRLSGRSLSYLRLKDISGRIENGNIVIRFTIYQSNKKRNEIAEYLKDMNREYIGLIRKKSSPMYRKEQETLKKEIIKLLGFKVI